VQADRQVRIVFCEKAESIALPVAAASMLAKYTREALMHRFNRYWQQHMPDLSPTAGYYTDGWRFLREIQDVRAKLGVRDGELIRSR
jgi:ribonuclease HII